MRFIARRRRFFLLAAAVSVACDPVTVCGCSPLVDAAVVYGRVTDPAGAPVAGATVMAEHAAAGCTEPMEQLAWVQTGADGRYRAHMAAHLRSPRPGDCLRAFADPPASSALGGSDTVAFAVAFRSSVPLDSVQVNLVLRAP